MTAFKLKAGSKDHENSPQHHVGGLVEEVVVQLGGVQQHLQKKPGVINEFRFST